MQWWQTIFIYTREAVELGEWWRIITSQFVHTNWAHYLLNISGLGMICLLFYTTLDVRTFTISLFLLVISVGIGLHLFLPTLHWYAGLSGALYGLYLIAAYSALKKKDYFMGISVAILVICKIIADHLFGITYDNSALIDARVVTEAHDYGVLSALVFIAFDVIYRYIKYKTISS